MVKQENTPSFLPRFLSKMVLFPLSHTAYYYYYYYLFNRHSKKVNRKMKFIILQENLKSALGNLQRAIPGKPQLPILSSVYLKAEKNSITLAATDLFLGVKSTVPAQVKEGGELVIPGEIFKNLIFSLTAGEVSIEKKGNSLLIKHENSQSSLPFQSAEEYPQFPEVVGKQYTLSVSLIRNIEQHVAFAAALDQTRPVLASLLLSFTSKGLSVVGTDGFRLATLHSAEKSDGLEQDLLIPVKALNEVFRLANQTQTEQVSFQVAQELKQVLFTIDGVEIYIRLIEGEYPPYQKIIPPEFIHDFKLDWQEFAAQVKRAFLFSRDTSNIITLEFKKGTMMIRASSPARGEYQGEMTISYTGEPLEIAFNALYLLDFLNIQREGELVFSMNESLKPAAFKIQDQSEYLYIVMPFRAANG
ncbi:MAG: polymerase III subunit beta protein [Parcubacteria group bacterium GW2011_GWB1_49_7]|nr:MAG: polymerase III subunit beta protein [Candidatus Pacebacteria bacterium GW2011_GWA1_46_10]KKW09935.1 MAG: polymerase III subunit beta protein [Parcubacteria group bacterium GW2011_GWB1_49_7]